MAQKKKLGVAGVATAGKAAKSINADTNNALSWVAVAAGGALLIMLYRFTKLGGSIADAASATLDGFTENLNNSPDSTNTGIGSGDNIQDYITISHTEAQNRAVMLLEAMDGAGTDFTRVKNALTGINFADYTLIADKFGTPRYFGTGQAPWPAPERNLSYWIVSEVDNDELAELRTLLPGVF